MTKKQEPVIEVKDIWKTYNLGEQDIHVLKGISFAINKGEFVAIVGKSGSGKTTLVNQIGCLDSPSRGDVILGSIPTSELTQSELAVIRGKKIGYVFQKFNLIKTLSAQENVQVPMMFQDISKDEREKRSKELLGMFDMSDRLINKPSELSGGQQQRVAIARALANEPEIILADEPTGNLDSKTGIVVMDFLQKLHKEGKTIILVTHDDNLSHYASRIITLHDGNIISDVVNDKKPKSKPKELLKEK